MITFNGIIYSENYYPFFCKEISTDQITGKNKINKTKQVRDNQRLAVEAKNLPMWSGGLLLAAYSMVIW